jgi:hypothetical protein
MTPMTHSIKLKYFTLAAVLFLLAPIAPSFADKTEIKPIAPAAETQTQIQPSGLSECKIQQAAAQAIDIAGSLITPDDMANLVVQTAKVIQDVKMPDLNLDPTQTQAISSALTLAQLMTRNLDAAAIKPTIASLYKNVSQTAKQNAQQCSGK